MNFILYFAKKKPKSMYEGASKQYQNPMKSTALTEPHNQQFILVSRP